MIRRDASIFVAGHGGLVGSALVRTLEAKGFENVLGCTVSTSLAAMPTKVEVSRSGPEEIDVWIDTIAAGFATPDTQGVPSGESFETDALREIMADMASTDGFVRYLARRSGEPAGAAGMRTFENIAQLTGAATLPGQRRQGVQTALLATRLEAALEAGCDVAVVTTQPGSKSQQNVQRQGFELLYTRALLVLAPSA